MASRTRQQICGRPRGDGRIKAVLNVHNGCNSRFELGCIKHHVALPMQDGNTPGGCATSPAVRSRRTGVATLRRAVLHRALRRCRTDVRAKTRSSSGAGVGSLPRGRWLRESYVSRSRETCFIYRQRTKAPCEPVSQSGNDCSRAGPVAELAAPYCALTCHAPVWLASLESCRGNCHVRACRNSVWLPGASSPWHQVFSADLISLTDA